MLGIDLKNNQTYIDEKLATKMEEVDIKFIKGVKIALENKMIK